MPLLTLQKANPKEDKQLDSSSVFQVCLWVIGQLHLQTLPTLCQSVASNTLLIVVQLWLQCLPVLK